MIIEEDEEMLLFKDDKESELSQFIKYVIKEEVSRELAIPEEEAQKNIHPTTYGTCRKPFGVVRTRIVEFLAEVYKVFCKEIHKVFVEADIYNKLIFFFEFHPFHNILHAKVTEIINHLLDKSYEDMIKHLLDETTLIKKILDISREGSQYTFETGSKMSAGYMAFVRSISNKLVEMQKKSPEVASCLESIPEWQEYFQNDLRIKNMIENKPLVNDPRKKGTVSNEDDLEFFFKLKNFNPTKKSEK